MLLIEFDSNKPFSLQGKYYMSRDVQSSDLVARLQLLTMHFPKLRILWSPRLAFLVNSLFWVFDILCSPHATAELVEELKKGRDEPDASKAATLGIDIVDDYNVDRFNAQIKDFVSKLPGINSKNIFAVLNKAENLLDLLDLSEVCQKLISNNLQITISRKPWEKYLAVSRMPQICSMLYMGL